MIQGRIRTLEFFILLGGAFILSSCQGKSADYYTLKPLDINYTILASCSVKYPKPLDINLESSGKVLKVLVHDGSIVRKGVLLVQLDDFNERQNLQINQQALASTRLKIKNARDEELPKLHEQEAQLKSDLQIAQNDRGRIKRLVESGVLARVDLENAENRYQKALSAYNQVKLTLDSYEKSGTIAALEQQVNSQQAQVELARKAVEDKKIFAPFNGTVSKVNVQRGESLQIGTIVLTLIEKSPWVLESEVDQKDLPFLETNLKAVVAFDAFPQDRVQADVVFVCALIDSQKGTCNLKFEVKENKSYIKYGMSGTAEINAGFYKQKLALPSRFVERKDGAAYAWCWNGKIAERIKLDYGQLGEQWIVVKNLTNGTKIILPIMGINPNMKLGREVTNK
jgi:HlyD family secretion protein